MGDEVESRGAADEMLRQARDRDTAAADPAALATDAAEALVASGVAFRDAHEQIAAQVRAGTFEPPQAGPRAAPGPGGAVAAIAARVRWSA